MNRWECSTSGCFRGVPRACGDEPTYNDYEVVKLKAFPAPAGMNRSKNTGSGSEPGVPRACGDEPDYYSHVGSTQSRSPRLRG